MSQLELFPELLKKEAEGINHTYELDLKIGNITPKQLETFQSLINTIKTEGALIWENKWEND